MTYIYCIFAPTFYINSENEGAEQAIYYFKNNII